MDPEKGEDSFSKLDEDDSLQGSSANSRETDTARVCENLGMEGNNLDSEDAGLDYSFQMETVLPKAIEMNEVSGEDVIPLASQTNVTNVCVWDFKMMKMNKMYSLSLVTKSSQESNAEEDRDMVGKVDGAFKNGEEVNTEEEMQCDCIEKQLKEFIIGLCYQEKARLWTIQKIMENFVQIAEEKDAKGEVWYLFSPETLNDMAERLAVEKEQTEDILKVEEFFKDPPAALRDMFIQSTIRKTIEECLSKELEGLDQNQKQKAAQIALILEAFATHKVIKIRVCKDDVEKMWNDFSEKEMEEQLQAQNFIQTAKLYFIHSLLKYYEDTDSDDDMSEVPTWEGLELYQKARLMKIQTILNVFEYPVNHPDQSMKHHIEEICELSFEEIDEKLTGLTFYQKARLMAIQWVLDRSEETESNGNQVTEESEGGMSDECDASSTEENTDEANEGVASDPKSSE